MIYIVGAGGLGREMAKAAVRCRFLDDNASIHGSIIANTEVVGTIEQLAQQTKKDEYLGFAYIGVGYPVARQAISERLSAASLQPTAGMTAGSSIGGGKFGRGFFLALGSVVTVDTEIGQHVAVLNNAVVGHDSIVGDFSVICPGAVISGRCNIGKRVLVGAGAVILPGVTIGDGAVVGAGAVVNRDVAPSVTVVGNPARVLG